jgi:hypothetical protein
MKYTKDDLEKIDHLILMLKDAKFEITGFDVLKYAETFKWVGRLYKQAEADVSPPTPPKIQEQNPPKTPAKVTASTKTKVKSTTKTKGK